MSDKVFVTATVSRGVIVTGVLVAQRGEWCVVQLPHLESLCRGEWLPGQMVEVLRSRCRMWATQRAAIGCLPPCAEQVIRGQREAISSLWWEVDRDDN